ncbi:hypothetical protein PVT67_08310 [Gallaecimonas kandeliae]|uniref:hypothetical protein n=1 Tax=Gallaecimonas kandeliae TaxID=3029055 RepID=UPI00264773CA|nr:hypothetical protein [Gallaecimonas kandeliae]WKE67225.1 hypothetical protein PVT67_08310 [Gallaecimonas kandeliae]
MNYIEEARRRATRRKSKWNLLLIPSISTTLLLLWWVTFIALESIHSKIYSMQNFQDTPNGIGVILSAIAPFLGLIPLSMLIGNYIVFLVHPARKALDTEAKGVRGTTFLEAQKGLLKLTMILIPIFYGLALVGVFLPWGK